MAVMSKKAMSSFFKWILNNNYTGAAVVRSYARSGMLQESRKLFSSIPSQPDVNEYNSRLSELMNPNMKKIDEALALLKDMETAGWEPNHVTHRILISGLREAGKTDAADFISQRMQKVTFATLVDCLCDEGKTSEAVEVVDIAVAWDCLPKTATFATLISGLVRSGQIEKARSTFFRMMEAGRCPNTVIFNIIIDGFAKEGKTAEAVELLDKMQALGCQPDAVTYSCIISGLLDAGRSGVALSIFNRMMMPEGCIPNTLTFSTLIDWLCKEGKMAEALEVLDKTMAFGGQPPLATDPSIVSGFLNAGRSDMAISSFSCTMEDTCSTDTSTLNTLIDWLAKEGKMAEALEAVYKMSALGYSPNTATCNSIISGWFSAGRSDMARSTFSRMMEEGCIPDTVTFNTLIDGLGKEAKTADALKIVDKMVPDTDTFSSIIYCLSKQK